MLSLQTGKCFPRLARAFESHHTVPQGLSFRRRLESVGSWRVAASSLVSLPKAPSRQTDCWQFAPCRPLGPAKESNREPFALRGVTGVPTSPAAANRRRGCWGRGSVRGRRDGAWSATGAVVGDCAVLSAELGRGHQGRGVVRPWLLGCPALCSRKRGQKRSGIQSGVSGHRSVHPGGAARRPGSPPGRGVRSELAGTASIHPLVEGHPHGSSKRCRRAERGRVVGSQWGHRGGDRRPA